MHFLSEYSMFLAKSITLVIAILVLVMGILVLANKNKNKEKEQGKLVIKKINDCYQDYICTLNHATLSKKELKALHKKEKNSKKENQKKRLFVLNFQGDIRASAVSSLREEITAILLNKRVDDEVLLRLESPGGMVNGYGLAASQLQRLKDAKIKLTIAVDKVAASGGYMMACLADQIIAAPFAIIGSIGVIAQLPNFHRLLEKKDIEFEQITAGQYKRTISLFGKNTREGRQKLQTEIDEAHELFKNHIAEFRRNVEIDQVATGEHWFAIRALGLRLIDTLQTSDDFLLMHKDGFDIFEVKYMIKKALSKRLTIGFNTIINHLFGSVKNA